MNNLFCLVAIEEARFTDRESKIYQVPTDFGTVADAVEALGEIYRARGTELIVNIESGHEIHDRIYVEDGYFANIKIESDDPIVNVSSSFDTNHNIIRAQRAFSPTLDCQIDAGGQGLNGLLVQRGFAVVETNAGVRNAGNRGILCRTGYVYAVETDFTGAANDGVLSTHGGVMSVGEADLSDAGDHGIAASRSGIVYADGATATNCTNSGARARRAMLSVEDANLSDCGRGANAEAASRVNARKANVSGASDRGINAIGGSVINAQGADITNTGEYGINANGSSRVNATGATVSGANSESALAARRSDVSLENVSFSSVSSGDVVRMTFGSLAVVENATVDGSPIADADIRPSSNTLTDDGIIFGDLS